MKKWQVCLLTTCVFMATTAVYASNYKEEIACPPSLVLQDGFYFGAAAGYDAYRIVTDVDTTIADGSLSFNTDPRLSVNGPVGGGLLGIGHYFESFYNTYLGFEIFGNGSGAQTDSELFINSASNATILQYTTSIKAESNYGLSLLPGIKLNKATLFYVRLGYNWSNIDVHEYRTVNGTLEAESPYDVTSSGFNYGLGLEAAVVPRVSLRGEYTHTDYSSFTTYFGTEVHPQDNQFMLALIFHFA